MLSLVLASACLCLLWMFLRRPEGLQPPMLPGAWPLIGHISDIGFKDLNQIWETLYNYTYFNLKNGGVSQGYLGPVKIYFVTDPDDCHTISNICLQKSYIYKFANLITNGLALIDPPLWKPHRKLLNRAFNQEHLNNYIHITNEESKILCERIRTKDGQGMFLPDPYIINLTFITACRITFGINSDECNKISKTYIDVVERVFDLYAKRLSTIWLHVPFIYNWSSLKKKSDEYTKTVADMTGSIIKKRKLELKEDKNIGKDGNLRIGMIGSILDLLIINQEEERITDAELQKRVNTMIIGNYDTTSISFLVTLKLIGLHSDAQEKIYEELKNVFNDQNGDLNRQDISKLVYLEAVIKEALRLYPVAPIIARKATEVVKLKDYTIPAGGNYIISIYGMHRHAVWGADAEQFRPERWLEPGGVPDNANAYGAFSIGKRNCIGKSYAMMSMKTTLAHLLLRYRITADDSKIKWKWNTFLKPVSGHEIAIKLRT